MRSRRLPHVLLLCAALVLGRADLIGAQSAASAAWQASPASTLKSALRAVAAAQTRYRDAKGTYAPAPELLGLRLEPGVGVEILRAGRDGWQGRATHVSRRGLSCVLFVGSLEGAEAPRTDGDHEMAGEEGVPLCDRMR